MKKRRLLVTLAVPVSMLIGIWGLRLVNAGQPPSFDRLADEDRQAFAKRFESEIWPLLARNGKDGCLGCHSGKVVAALKLTGKVEKDFPKLLRDGFFLWDDDGSLLARVSDKDSQRRMPKGKTPWTDKEVQILRAFTADLDKNQKK